MPLKVFINYRHEDLEGTVWAIYDKLSQRFGRDNVFFDNGTLKPGMEWFEEIKSHVAGAGVFLCLMGAKWMPSLVRRMQEGGADYVAEEIDLAFRSGSNVKVVPVLLGEAEPPDRDLLPPALQPLSGCQSERLRFTDLLSDLDVLIHELGTPPPAVLADADDGGAQEADGNTGGVEEAGGVTAPGLERAAGGAEETGGATSRGPGTGAVVAGTEPRRQIAPPPDDDHFQSVAEEAENLVVFLGADVNTDDHDGSWPSASGSVPDDAELARYLADKVKLSAGGLAAGRGGAVRTFVAR